MIARQRYSVALVAALKHLFFSALVALLCAVLVFGLWYPHPYDQLVGGRELFLLVIIVDVICGPLLTFVVFNPAKPRRELVRDISIIVLLQFAALSYGLYSVAEARPVFLSYEGNRFRVVTLPEIEIEKIGDAQVTFRDLSLTGPKLIAARLSKGTDPDFRESIQLSLMGLPPSFRPARWLPFDEVKQEAIEEAKPVKTLVERYPDKREMIDAALLKVSLRSDEVGYLPLEARSRNDWIVLLNTATAQPVGFLPIDGW